jgi:hypothetical protein
MTIQFNNGNYTVAEITTEDGVFYTARNDDRSAEQVVQDGINGFEHGNDSPIYASLVEHQTCTVVNIYTGLDKNQAEARRRVLIEDALAQGKFVLNQIKKKAV